MIELKDWKVVLGWDASKVKAGLKSLNAQMERVERKQAVSEKRKQREIDQAYKKKEREEKKLEANWTKAEKQKQRQITSANKQKEVERRNQSRQEKIQATLREKERRKEYAENKRNGLHKQRQIQQQRDAESKQRQVAKENYNQRKALAAANIAERKKLEALDEGAGRKKEAASNRDRRRQLQEIEFLNRRNRMISNLNDLSSRVSSNERKGIFSGNQASGLRSSISLGAAAASGANTPQELAQVQGIYNGIVATTRSATRAATDHANEIRKATFAANSLGNSIKNMASSWLSIYAAFEGVSAFYRVGVAFDSMKATSLAAAGDSKTAGENMKFLVESSQRLGTNLQAGVMGFNKLSIAARAAGYDNKTIRDIFTGTSESITAYQLNDEQQKNIFYALSQMASKTRISTEELQRQMGDYLPSAMPAMVKAYSEFSGKDINAGQLIELISAGKVLSKDVLPGFAKHLGILAREGGALAAAMEKVATEQKRFNNQVQLNTDMGFSESQGAFANGWKQLTGAMKAAQPVFIMFGRIFGGLFSGIAVAIRIVTPLVTAVARAFNNVFEIFSGAGKKATAALAKTSEELTVWDRVALKAAAAAYSIAAGVFYLIAAFEGLSEWITVKESDSGLEKTLKSLVSLFIAGAAAMLAWKKAIAPLIASLGRLLGLAKQVSTAVGLTSAGASATTTAAGAASSTLLGTIARRVPLIAGAGVAMDVGSSLTGDTNFLDTSTGKTAINISPVVSWMYALYEMSKKFTESSPTTPAVGSYGSGASAGRVINVEVTNQFNGASQADAARAANSIVKTMQDQLTMENV
jgi:tape measure domain-containing protein